MIHEVGEEEKENTVAVRGRSKSSTSRATSGKDNSVEVGCACQVDGAVQKEKDSL